MTKEMERLAKLPRVLLAQLPTPMYPLKNFSTHINGLEIWIKRDDLTGLAGGGNKTRKLEYLIGDAIQHNADTLVTVGAVQSNHTRQTASAAAKCGLKCALLHCHWTNDAGPVYRSVGNILISSILGAELYLDEKERPIEDEGPLQELTECLRRNGRSPYMIPGGASDHHLGSMGYITCAQEIIRQSKTLKIDFDYIVHCTGSSSTQSGLIAGLAAAGAKTRVIGISDDDEIEIKKARVLRLASAALEYLYSKAIVTSNDVEIHSATSTVYGMANVDIIDSIKLFAQSEGLMADPVYEGKAIRGLIKLAQQNRFEKNSKILLMHLGGTPAIHGYANHFEQINLTPFPRLKNS